MRSVERPRRSDGENTVDEPLFSRLRPIVLQAPFASRRCSWTTRPRNERAAVTCVAIRWRDATRIETTGRTPTVTVVLVWPFQMLLYVVAIAGRTVRLHAPV